ncbi:MAG: methylmalonyl-CoA epimerase [Halanaerobiales bacterium]|nr:methylmalonyl-CoA epimerase [Halanaerobiales bacterium]
MKIDHVGIAVKSVDESLKFYKDILGLELKEIEVMEDRGLKIAFLKTGESKIELLEPTSDDSNIAKFIEKKGEGIHHLALEVDDVDENIESMEKLGTEFIGEASIGAGGKKIIFMHPKSTNGVLMELCQSVKEE